MTEKTASQQLETFFSQFQAFSFKEKDTLLRHGEKAAFVYYLKSGVIKQNSTSPDGQETTITMYKPGAFFPLIWALKDTAVPYDFQAITNGHGWKAPREEVSSFLKKTPEVCYDLCLRLLSGLEGLGRKLEFALQATANIRVAEALVTLAYRFGQGKKQDVRIDIEFTHQELAELTGLSRETVTRELKLLREQGLVEITDQHFSIPKLADLELISGVFSGE